MTDEAAFLAAVIDAPDDDSPRLIYADWLDEQGQCDRAEFIRVQCELFGLIAIIETYPVRVAKNGWGVGLRDRKLAAFYDRAEVLRRRERELLDRADDGDELPHRICWIGTDNPSYLLEDALRPVFRRGFVESLACSWPDCRDQLDAIRAAQPVNRIELTTLPELRFQGDGEGPHVIFGLDGREQRIGLVRWGERDDERHLHLAALAAEWPGVEFVLRSWHGPCRLRNAYPAWRQLADAGLLSIRIPRVDG